MVQKKSNNCTILVITVLIISLVFNIISSIENYKIKFKIGKEAYINSLNVRTINETNNDLLNKIIKVGSVNNSELLKLYVNYSNISDNVADLCYEYNDYMSEKRLYKSIKIDTNSVLVAEVHERIEEYLKNLLDIEMKKQGSKVILKDKVLEQFKEMLSLSEDIKQFYTEFSEEKLNGLNDEEKIKVIVKKHYWVNILEGLNKINERYLDVEFII